MKEMKSLNIILLSLVIPSYQGTERFQECSFQIITDENGQVCLSNTVSLYTAPTVRVCASLVSMEQLQTGATVFTFDNIHFTCRSYVEEDFNVCSFEVCSGCVSYRLHNDHVSSPTVYYPETSSVAPTTANPENNAVTNSAAMTTTVNTVSCNNHGGMYPHPTDCTKYIECVWSTAVTRDCPAGLHFNANINVCDFPASAGCQS